MNRENEAAEYIAAGFALCATRPENQKEAYGAGWQTKGRTSAHWLNNTGDGMGVIHGMSGTCSIDLDDMECSRIALDAVGVDIDALLSSGVQIDSGRDNRAKLLYRAPDGLPDKRHALNWPAKDGEGKNGVLEIRAGKTHDALPPSVHPTTGKPYRWVGEWRDLPELPDCLEKLWHEWPLAKDAMQDACPWDDTPDTRAPVSAVLAPRPAGGHNDVIGQFNRAFDIDSILQTHGYRKAGRRWMPPNSSTGIPGVVRLPDSEPLKIYSFHGSDPLCDDHAHDAFSVYTMLDHNGDATAAVAQAASDLGIEPPRDPEIDAVASRLMAGKREPQPGGGNVAPFEVPKKPEMVPEEMTAPNPGAMPVYIAEQVKAWLASQVHNVKDDAVTQTTLAVMCAIASRRYQTTSGQPVTTFFGISDSSTAGIRPLRDAAYKLCRQIGERRLIRGTGINGSHPLYQSFLRYPRMFWATDEYGTMVMRTKRQTSGAIESALGVIHEMYGGQTLFIDPDTATTGKPRDIKECDIYAPSFTMLALLGHAQVSAMTSKMEYSRGTLQQMLLVPAGDNGRENWDVTPSALPAGLIELVKRLADMPGIAGAEESPTTPPQMTTVKWSREAGSVFSEAHRRLKSVMDTPERDEFRGMAHGYLQSAIRLASGMAAWQSPERPEITPDIAGWCCQWAERCLSLSMPRIEAASGEEEQGVQELVLDVLRQSDNPMTAREIGRRCRALRNLKPEDRDAVMQSLHDDGQVIAEQRSSKQKTVHYAIARRTE